MVLNLFILFASVGIAFPIGMGITVFLRWFSQTRQDARRQKVIENYWRFLGTWGVPYSLLMAMLKAVERNAQGLEEYLFECALFVVMFFGAWFEARRVQRRRS